MRSQIPVKILQALLARCHRHVNAVGNQAKSSNGVLHWAVSTCRLIMLRTVANQTAHKDTGRAIFSSLQCVCLGGGTHHCVMHGARAHSGSPVGLADAALNVCCPWKLGANSCAQFIYPNWPVLVQTCSSTRPHHHGDAAPALVRLEPTTGGTANDAAPIYTISGALVVCCAKLLSRTLAHLLLVRGRLAFQNRMVCEQWTTVILTAVA
jgi:hypothetical protein